MSSSIAPSSSISQSTTTIDSSLFDDFMARTYPDHDTTASSTGSRKRRTKGHVRYSCRFCTPVWYSPFKANALKHIKSEHHDTIPTTDRGFQQRAITSLLRPTVSHDTLRSVFNRQAYREAIVGLLTVRRVPFSAVEWSELRQLCLACNPACDPDLITSRRTAVRLIAANYALYSDQLQTSLSTIPSLIHIQSDLWTSPHNKALLAVYGQ
jgi:hypothetical protein